MWGKKKQVVYLSSYKYISSLHAISSTTNSHILDWFLFVFLKGLDTTSNITFVKQSLLPRVYLREMVCRLEDDELGIRFLIS